MKTMKTRIDLYLAVAQGEYVDLPPEPVTRFEAQCLMTAGIETKYSTAIYSCPLSPQEALINILIRKCDEMQARLKEEGKE